MRLKNLFGFFIVISLIFAALILQYFKHLNPCPLCIMQRIAFIVLAFLFLVFTILPQRLYLLRLQGALIFLSSAAGLGVAIRQLYLQHLPAGEAPACGPGLDYLLQTFPLHQVFTMVLQGSGECAVVDWRFLGLSMAAWSAVWLAVFAVWGVLLIFKKFL